MNQRIRYLAEQAGYEPDVCGLHLDPRIEWFAQSILRECAKVMRDAEREADRAYEAGEIYERREFDAYDFAELIKQHFGVE